MKVRPAVVLVHAIVAIVGVSARPALTTVQPTLEASRPKVNLPPPPRRLPPNRVQPGGGLDEDAQSCTDSSTPLTAIAPISNPVYTASAHPSFLFYLPDSPEAVDYVEFNLMSEDEKERIHRVRFRPTQYGIVNISVPSTARSLVVGEAYHWYLNLYCNNISSIPSVDGWVQRIGDDEAVEMTPVDADGIHADIPMIWYDAIAQVATALATDTTPSVQVVENWQSWLSAVGLEGIANLPLGDSQSSGQFNLQLIQSDTD